MGNWIVILNQINQVKPIGTPIKNASGRTIGYTGEGEGMSSVDSMGDGLNRSSTSNALASIASLEKIELLF